MATSLIIQAMTSGGKALAKNIPYVNPAITNRQCSEFAKLLNGLTTNRYVTAYRVDKLDVEASIAEEEQSNG